MKTIAHFLLLILIGLFSNISSAQQGYSNVIAFGDSLSDTGNLLSELPFSLPEFLPFYENRISNGPVALDIMAEELGYSAAASFHLLDSPSGYNYAVAGGNVLGNDPEDLESQVNAHLSRVNNTTDPEALYVLIMGGNDIRGIRSITSATLANAEIELIVDQLILQLTRLSDAGAQQLFVANVPNIGVIPQTLQLGETVSAQAQLYTQTYNALLKDRLTIFSQQTGVNIKLFDLYEVLEGIISNASQLGFTNTQEGCFLFDLDFDISDIQIDFHEDCLFGLRFDRFVFFDNLHPTNATNQIVAQAMIEKLNEPEPEPEPDQFILPIGAIMLLLED